MKKLLLKIYAWLVIPIQNNTYNKQWDLEKEYLRQARTWTSIVIALAVIVITVTTLALC